MISRLWLANRRDGMSVEAFAEHWGEVHAMYAARMVGLRSYRLSLAALPYDDAFSYAGFDGCSELQFDSVRALQAAFNTRPIAEATLHEDGFAAPDRGITLLAERRVLQHGEPAPGAVRLMTLMRANPATGEGPLRDALRGPYRAAVARTRPVSHELYATTHQQRSTDPPPVFDAIDSIFFVDREAARRYVTGPHCLAAALSLAGLVFGRERALVGAIPLR